MPVIASPTKLIMAEMVAICRRIKDLSKGFKSLLTADRSAVKSGSHESGAGTVDGNEHEKDTRSAQLDRLLVLVRTSEIVAPPTDFTVVRMGQLVTVRITVTGVPKGRRESGEILNFVVGGDSHSCSDEKPSIFSHAAPFVQKIMGKAVGEVIQTERRGESVEVEVLRIERFSPAVGDEALLQAVLEIPPRKAIRRHRRPRA